jgi:hypothetical protein
LLSGDVWTQGGSKSTPGTLANVTETRKSHQEADPGATGAPVHSARGALVLGKETMSIEWRGCCVFAGKLEREFDYSGF